MRLRKAAQHWQLLSRADAKGRVDFINPAVVRRGEFVVTVSTSGASPGLTRKMKAELEEQFGEPYAEYVFFLKQARKQILRLFSGEKKKQRLQICWNHKFCSGLNKEKRKNVMHGYNKR